jgi:hypothetical protein
MIIIGLDLLLAGLLVAALVMGVRLNTRLKALRASQHDFAQAVVELDAAAVRAESGLNALRSAAEEAHDSLLARIDTARSLAARLEKAEASADGAARRAEAAAAEAKAIPAAPTVAPAPIRPLTPLREMFARAETQAPVEAPRAAPPPRPTPRRRPLADESLFADPDDARRDARISAREAGRDAVGESLKESPIDTAAVRPGLEGLMRMSLARR